MSNSPVFYISLVNAELNALSANLDALTESLGRELRERESDWVEAELRKHAPVVCTLVDSGQPTAASRLLQALGFELALYPNGDIELRQCNRVLSRLPSPFVQRGEMAFA